jgi:hypothetical protein
MEHLVKHLISNGIEEDTANKIAASYQEETVDTENLQKALNDIAEVMSKSTAAAETVETEETTEITETVEETETVEKGFSDTTKALEEAHNVADAVTRGADALLAEVREQNDALAKGLLAIGEEMRAVREFLNNQYGAVAQVTEQVEAVKKSLSEPTLQKSITSDTVESPYEEKAPETNETATLLEKAMDEIKTTGDDARKAVLLKAITQLECGVPANTVKYQFGI